MRKTIALTFMMSIALAGSAQVIINPQTPPLGLVLKSQLWSMGIINSGNLPLQAQVQILMTVAGNNQQVLSGVSKTITLPKGLTQVTAASVAPVTYNVLSPGYGLDASPDGFLPIGAFTICYTVTAQGTEGQEAVAEECENVDVLPISPPSLVFPIDSESIEITRPMFTWLPPAPYNLFTSLTYSFNLVEILQGQASSDAIQLNVPVQSQIGFAGTSYQYPASLPELDTGKLYAWQVTANNGNAPLSNSEIWTFRVKKLGIDSSHHAPGGNYIRAKRSIDAGYGVCKGVLRYAYLSESSQGWVNCSLYDLSTPKRQEIQLDSSYLQVHFGQNYNELDFTENSLLVDKHLYLLELVNPRGEHWYVRFEYIKPN